MVNKSSDKGRVALKRNVSNAWSIRLFYLKLSFIFKKAFLPNGYPYSVSEDYLEYQLWDSIQAFASSIMNNLATQAVFKGVGVGDANATVLAATITWILRDGTSIIGSLIFATIQSTKMDSYCKRWRLFADLLNDVAICIDLISPMLGRSYFTMIQCISGIFRSLVGIAGGATRAALTQHQAKCNNLADVSAKDNSQERMVNLFALVFSLVLIPLVSEQTSLIWTLFITFTILHIYANFRAIKSVRIDVFNANRLANFLERFVTGDKDFSVESINHQENVWFFVTNFDRFDQFFEHVSINYSTKPAVIESPENADFFYTDDRFMISISKYHRFEIVLFHDISDGNSHLRRNSPENSKVIIEALFVVFLLKYWRNQPHSKLLDHFKPKVQDDLVNAFAIVEHQNQSLFVTMEKNGWNLNHLLLFELFNDYAQEDQQSNDEIDTKKVN